MKILENEHDLRNIETSNALVKSAQFAKIGEELAARDVIEKHVERIVIGEGGEEVGDEGMAGNLGEDSALMTNVVNLLELDDLCLPQDFQGVDFGLVLLVVALPFRGFERARIGGWTNEADTGESACSQSPDDREVRGLESPGLRKGLWIFIYIVVVIGFGVIRR